MVKDAYQQELDVRNYISSTENRNIFIEAGAGAGKSTSLVDRTYYSLAETIESKRIREDISSGKKTKQEIINELSDFTGCTDKEIAFRNNLINEIDDIIAGKVPELYAKDIFAITFTNKATEELRKKIIEKLNETKDCTLEEIWRKKQILEDIDNIHISTIHKFCEDILKENAVKAGLSPNFTPVIDDEEQEITDGVIRDFFRHFRYWNLFEKYEVVGLERKDIKEGIVLTFKSFLSTADRITKKQIYRCKAFRGDGLSDYHDAIAAFLEAVDDFIETYPKNEKKNTPYSTKTAIKASGYENGQSDDEREEAITKLMSLTEKDWFKEGSAKEGQAPFISNPKDDVKGIIFDDLVPHISVITQKRNDVFIGIAQLYIDCAYDLYELYLHNRDNDVERLTSNDLVYRTFILLDNDPNVLAKASNKIKRLFIDEYQDTDSLQYQIASLIAGNRDDCLYLVGDPKQSIYRFRGAEPDVFFDTKDLFAADQNGHAIYDLNINFRSNSKIIEWVNKRYSNIDLIEPSVGYKYSSMQYAKKNEISDADYQDDTKLTGFYRYGAVTQDAIKDLIINVKEKYLIREDGKFREVQYGDIMVLMEGHNTMPGFVETFTKSNIPTRVYGESRFFNTLVVRSFVALFEAILVDTDSSLAEVEAVFYNIYPSLYVGKKYEDCKEVTKGLLNALRNKTSEMNAYGKAIYLVEHMSLLAKEKHIYEDFEINFAASKLYQMIETIFSKGFFNGNELIEEFKKFLDQSIERESFIKSDVNAVMLINLHKAKGLEAPIVIWVSTKTSDKFADGISDAYKKKVLYPSILTNYVRKSDLYSRDVLDLKKDEEFEVARKEYVAVTRPGEAFIFADTEENTSMFHGADREYHFDDDDVKDILFPADEEEEEQENEEPEEEEIEEDDILEGDDEEEEEEEPAPIIIINEELVEDADDTIPLSQREQEHDYQVGSTLPKTTSPSSLEASISPTRETLRQQAGELPPSNRPKSNDVGTILHRALELLIKDDLTPEQAVCFAIDENIDLVPLSDNGEFKAFFLACVDAFNNWFNKEGYTLYPEFGFSYFGGNQINNGSIDLLMVNDKECIIIDYKSDEAEYIIDDETFEKTLVEKYENQLNGYQSVVEHLFPNKPITKKIIYFRRYNDQAHTIDVKSLEL